MHRGTTTRQWHLLLLGVALAAFAVRLIPVLRGAGLTGMGNYDDGVYYSAAVALVHGRLPYRDFVLLHPPGIVVALAPFAALGQLITDLHGLAVARVAFMLVGALNAVLVARFLLPMSVAAGWVGGLFYAIFYPAVYTEHLTVLEPLAGSCLLMTLLLLRTFRGQADAGKVALAMAGALMALSAGLKIWGVVPLIFIGIWQLVTIRSRRVLWYVAGAGIAGVALCLPFLAAAPAAMWQLVVVDQLDRPTGRTALVRKLFDITGLNGFSNPPSGWSLLLIIAVAGYLMAGLLAWTRTEPRLPVGLAVVLTALLLVTPAYFPHYASLIAGPYAIVVGAAAGILIALVRHHQQPALAALVAGLLTAVAVTAIPVAGHRFGKSFPARQLAASVAPLPGCVTADDPLLLVQLNVLSRDFKRSCQVRIDVTGSAYGTDKLLLRNGKPAPRRLNTRWQRNLMIYLRSGTATILVRTAPDSLPRAMVAEIRQWPVLAHSRRYVLYRPQHRPG